MSIWSKKDKTWYFVLRTGFKKKENIGSKIHTNTFLIFGLAHMKKIKFFDFFNSSDIHVCNFCPHLHFLAFFIFQKGIEKI